MNDYDVVFLDEDGRNAVINRPRPMPGRPGRPRPGGSSVVVPSGSRPTVIHSGGGATNTGGYYAANPMGYPNGPRQYFAPPRTPFGMPVGELIELGAKVLAAVLPLPVSPVAEGELEVDVDNLIDYQSRLATHAKRDEQIRTLGDLLGRFVR